MSARDTSKLSSSRRTKRALSAVTRTPKAKTSVTKTTGRTFIDEATFRIPYKGSLPSTRQQVIDADGVIGFDGHNRLPLAGAHGAGHMFLRTLNRRELWVKCCISKFLFGHNAAGYTHLPRAVKRLLRFARTFVKGTLNQPWRTPARKDVQLDSVSITRHLRFATEEEASRAVDQIQQSISARGMLSLAYMAGETITSSINRRLCSVTFYVKAKELRAGRHDGRHASAESILAAVDGFLRVEIRLTPMALKRFGIETADRWKHDTADRVFSRVFADFDFLALCPIQAQTAESPDMPKPLQRAVALVRSGTALHSAYAPSSSRRLEAQAAEYGLDLRAPAIQGDALVVLLAPERRWVTDMPDEAKRIPGFDKQYGKPESSR